MKEPDSDLTETIPEAEEYLLDENNKRLIDSIAAKEVAARLDGRVVWADTSLAFGRWVGTHWRYNRVNSDPPCEIADEVDRGCSPLGYRVAYRKNIVQQIIACNLLPPKAKLRGVVPFQNGILDIDTGSVQAATPEYSTDYVLPHAYEPGSKCPNIVRWLSDSMNGDEDTVQLLRAWLAALVREIPLQNILVLVGPGGTGKGVFQRLATALVGEENTAICTLRNLEQNRFEIAKLFGRRLCSINEAGAYDGEMNQLKAITGGDRLSLERKYQQQSASFVFHGLVLIATNENFVCSDAGIERRRLTVRFDRQVSVQEQARWRDRGGEESVLHAELPGLICWLLEMTEKEIHERINQLPDRVLADNKLGMMAGSSIAEWVDERCVFDAALSTQVGSALHMGGGSRKELRLYPDYREWCDRTGTRAEPQNKFVEKLIQVASSLGFQLGREKHPKSRGVYISGIGLESYVPRSASDSSDSSSKIVSIEGTEVTRGETSGREIESWGDV